MVVHHWRLREPRWKAGLAINVVGAIATGIVLLVVVVSKFTIGAWIPVVLIPLFVLILARSDAHYRKVHDAVAAARRLEAPALPAHTSCVLVGNVNRACWRPSSYARSLAPDRLVAVSVVGDADEQEALLDAWARFRHPGASCTPSTRPTASSTAPVLQYLDELDAESPDDMITVIIPEFVLTSGATQLLHNQSAFALKARLLYRPHTAVISVPVVVETS